MVAGDRPRRVSALTLSLWRTGLFCIGCFAALFHLPAHAQWHQGTADIMGTRVSVELWHRDGIFAEEAIAAVMADMRAVDRAFSPMIGDSELSRLNATAAAGAVSVSDDLYALIDKSLFYSVGSEGAFDISFASVGRFYDYRNEVAPSSEQLSENIAAINYQLIELDKTHRTVRYRHPELKIDLGGIAKGYAVDRAIALLQARGITSAIVSAGGDSRILGDRRGTPWIMGIRHPRKQGEFAVKIPLINSAISTSGDYERFFLRDGVRVHHILNPDTGTSSGEVQSVSILAPLAVDSDALSTTVFVLGIKKGLALVNAMTAIDAIIIDSDGKLHYSQGLLRSVEPAQE